MLRTYRFTLIEMLVVMSIIIVLAGMLMVGIGKARHKSRVVHAESDIRLIETSVSSYRTTYGSLFPYHFTINSSGSTDYLFSDNPASGMPSVANLLETLQGLDPMLNPRRIAFLEGGVATEDPWGQSYRVAVDTEYDDDVEDAFIYGLPAPPLARSMAIWSRGPDGEDSATDSDPVNDDNVTSW